MSRTNMIGKTATNVYDENDATCVRYHQTVVVRWTPSQIILNSGGYQTKTTKLRMNQASNQYNLGFSVYQNKHQWFVDFKGETLEFEDGMVLNR